MVHIKKKITGSQGGHAVPIKTILGLATTGHREMIDSSGVIMMMILDVGLHRQVTVEEVEDAGVEGVEVGPDEGEAVRPAIEMEVAIPVIGPWMIIPLVDRVMKHQVMIEEDLEAGTR